MQDKLNTDINELSLSVQVRLAGVPILLLDGETRKTFRSRRALGLLAYLVCQRRPIPRSELVDLLWPDKDESKGRGNLRWAASYLANLMPGCLERTRQAIQFIRNNETHTVDIVALDYALEQGDVEMLIQLIPHVQGEFMQGVYFDESAEFESWVVSQRERIRQQVSDAFVFIVGQLAIKGKYERALGFAQQWVKFTPWEEQAHRWTMELFARLGQISSAIKQYQICCRNLEEELGSEPSAKITSLFERLEQMATGGGGELLTQRKELFIGRVSELTTVHQYRKHRQDRLIVFTGAEGCGKTRLAHAVVDEDPLLMRQRLISINADDAKSPEYLAEIILQALIIRTKIQGSSRVRDTFEHVENVLFNRDPILLLDDVPDVKVVASTLQSWLITAPRVTILATSRQPCHLSDGKVVSLPGLSQDAAVMLFTQTCEQRLSGFQVQANDSPHLRAICSNLENHPRSLLLAATLIDTFRCEEIAEMFVERMKEFPDELPSERVAHFVWSVLPEQTQIVLQQLNLLTGPFTLQIAEEITGIEWRRLKVLAEQSLLRLVDDNWYVLPHPIKEYILIHAPYPNQNVLGAKYAEYVIGSFETADNPFINHLQTHIHAVWEWMINNERTDLLRKIAIPYAKKLDDHMRWQTGYDIFHRAVEQFRADRRHKLVQPHLLYGEGLFAMRLRQYEQANHSFSVGHRLISGSKSPVQALFPLQLGRLAMADDRHVDAYDWFQQAYTAGHQHNNLTVVSSATLSLLKNAFWMGKWKDGEKWTVDTTAVPATIACMYHFWQGQIAVAQGEYDTAANHVQSTYHFAEKTSLDWTSNSAKHLDGIFQLAQSNVDEAQQLLDKAIRGNVSTQLFRTHALCSLARLQLRQGDRSYALQLIQKAQGIFSKTHDMAGQIFSLLILGDIQTEENRLEDAAGMYLSALVKSHSAPLSLDALSMHGLAGLAHVAWYSGNYTLADRLSVGVMHSPTTHDETHRQLPPLSNNSATPSATVQELIDELLGR